MSDKLKDIRRRGVVRDLTGDDFNIQVGGRGCCGAEEPPLRDRIEVLRNTMIKVFGSEERILSVDEIIAKREKGKQ